MGVNLGLRVPQSNRFGRGRAALIENFLALHTSQRQGLFRRQKLEWTDDDFLQLLYKLGCTGYGWLRPDGVRRKLEEMAAQRT